MIINAVNSFSYGLNSSLSLLISFFFSQLEPYNDSFVNFTHFSLMIRTLIVGLFERFGLFCNYALLIEEL